MSYEQQLIAVVGTLWLALSGMAGVVYRELRAQIADKNARIAALEAEAKEAVRAKDKEVEEWRRLALNSTGQNPPR